MIDPKKKYYRVEYVHKFIVEGDNYNEVKREMRKHFGEDQSRIGLLKRVKVDRVKKDFTFTKEVERNDELLRRKQSQAI